MQNLTRRSLLGCCALTISGCTGRLSDDQTEHSAPPLSGSSEGWTTARGTIAGTGRADTNLSGPYDTEWLWQYDTELSVPIGQPQWYRSTPGVVATEETVVATAADLNHSPVAIDRVDPSLRWHLEDLIDAGTQEFYRTPTPVAAGGSLFIHTHNRCCRIANDEIAWTNESGLWPGSTLSGNQSELYVTGSITRINPQSGTTRGTERATERGMSCGLAVTPDKAVQTLRFDAENTGAVTGYDSDWNVDWECPLDTRPRYSPPAIHNGRAFVLTERGTVSIDLTDGTVDWRSDDPNERLGVGVDESGTVYVPHSEELLVALDPTSGDQLWTAAADNSLEALLGESGRGYAPIVADDAVVISGWDGIAILARGDGSLRWKTDWDIVGAPAVAFGDLYAITAGGVVAVRGN